MLSSRKVTCEQCGASIRLGAPGRFVVCRYCGSTLEMIQAIARPSPPDTRPGPGRVADIDEVALLRLELELKRVEEEWERKRQSLLVRDDHGNAYEPDDPQGMILSIAAIGGGVLIPLFSGLSLASSGLGLVVTVAGVFLMLHARSRASDFSRLRRHYSQERMRIVAEISRLRRGSSSLRARMRDRVFGGKARAIQQQDGPPRGGGK